jgi:hypothetical protein
MSEGAKKPLRASASRSYRGSGARPRRA